MKIRSSKVALQGLAIVCIGLVIANIVEFRRYRRASKGHDSVPIAGFLATNGIVPAAGKKKPMTTFLAASTQQKVWRSHTAAKNDDEFRKYDLARASLSTSAEFRRRERRRNVERTYGVALSTLGLPPLELTQIKRILSSQDEFENEIVNRLGATKEIAINGEVLNQINTLGREDTLKRITDTVGPEVAAAVVHFSKIAQQLLQAAALQTECQYNGCDFSSDQIVALANSYAEVRANYPVPELTIPETKQQQQRREAALEARNSALASSVSGYLNPTQFKILESGLKRSAKNE